MSEHINLPSSSNDRKDVQDTIAEMAKAMQEIADKRAYIKDCADRMKSEYELEPKLVRKVATALFKHNFAEAQADYENFEAAYEILVEGRKDAS